MAEAKNPDIEYEQESEESGEVDLAEKIKKLREKLKQCQKEKQDYLNGWQRCQADFINYKRRQEKQMAEWFKILGEGLIRDLLPLLDTLDASIKNSSDNQGLLATREQLIKILKQHGLEEIKSVGEKFNPEWHEAVEQVESGGEKGVVVEEVQKGYMLDGKVIRAAKVKVAK